jgi:hypothetical protein
MRKLIAITAACAFIPSAAVFGQTQVPSSSFRTLTLPNGQTLDVGTWNVGSSPNNGAPEFSLSFKIPGPSLPEQVFCQTQQGDNADHGFGDEFNCQVVERAFDHVVVKIRRSDIAGDGWGQDLNVNLSMFF